MNEISADVSHLSQDYRRDGVVVIRNALPPYWLDILRQAVDDELAKGKRYFAYRNMRTEPGLFQDFCLNSGIGRLVADLNEASRTTLVFDQLFAKEPGTRTRTGWHTDQPYWPVAGPIITAWIALDPVDADNGALEFIPGSHAWGKMYRPFLTDQAGNFVKYLVDDTDSRYSEMPDFEAERQNHRIVHYDLEPGDILAFDGFIVHSAMGNRTSTRRRRGYAVRFATEGATYQPDQGVADWLTDDAILPGAPYESERFPVVYRSN